MTNPLSHKCDNYSEPDQLRGDSDSKKYVSKYKQLLIPFCKLINNCSQFLRKCSFFLFIFEMIYIGVWMLHLGTDFSCKKMGSKDTMVTYWHDKRKNTHLKYRSIFLANVFKSPEKQTNWVWKVDAFRLVDMVEFTALLQ